MKNLKTLCFTTLLLASAVFVGCTSMNNKYRSTASVIDDESQPMVKGHHEPVRLRGKGNEDLDE